MFIVKKTVYFFLTGLGVDGIYRVSGNLAVIQKLRFKADHGNFFYLKYMIFLCSFS